MTPGFAFDSWAECDLRERPISEFSKEKEITMELHAYEIKTVLVKL